MLPFLFLLAQDFQVWNEVDLTASFRRIDFLIPMVVRADTHLPNPQLVAAGITADIPLPWRLTLTGGYLFADLPQASFGVHLPLVAISKSFHAGRFTLTDRNRFEKLIGYPTAPLRYRNRMFLDRPLKRWHVFAADEVIFNLTNSAWSQNRAQAGVGASLNERLALDFYYLQRNADRGAAAHVLATTLRIKLTP